MEIIERMIEANDKPRAEVIIDVQILEVSRERAKQYGLNLSDYAIGVFFSPEVGAEPTRHPRRSTSTRFRRASARPTSICRAERGVRFLESDSQTKVLAKPQLRGTRRAEGLAEPRRRRAGSEHDLHAAGDGRRGHQPADVVRLPHHRHHRRDDAARDLRGRHHARPHAGEQRAGRDANIAGQTLPAFISRKVATKLRLRDGESNLLAGLLREDERRSLTGFPGLLRMPVIQQLFGNNDTTIRQTDIVMLLTPRIVRSHELTATDLAPIYIGPQSNMSLGGGPPPLINPPAGEPAPAVPPPPPGASPMPGLPPKPPAHAAAADCRPSQHRCRRPAQPAPVPPPAAPAAALAPRLRLRAGDAAARRRQALRGSRSALPPRCASAPGPTPCRSRSPAPRACRRFRFRSPTTLPCCACAACRKARSCGRAASRRRSRSRSTPRRAHRYRHHAPGDQTGAVGQDCWPRCCSSRSPPDRPPSR